MAGATKLQKYKKLIQNLLPKGKLWNVVEQPLLGSFIESLATELCRVDDRVGDLLKQFDPRTADLTLEDWERVLGLPDECTPDDLTLDERKNQILQKYTTLGELNIPFYEFIGQQLGFEVIVTDYTDFRAGFARAGDRLTNFFNEQFVAGSLAGEQLTLVGWRFYFEVNMPASAAEVFEAGDVAGTPLREFSNPLIECTMRKLKPAHSAVFFTFRE